MASCSLPSVVLGRRLFQARSGATFFDAGSIWEPFLGSDATRTHPRSWYAKIENIERNLP